MEPPPGDFSLPSPALSASNEIPAAPLNSKKSCFLDLFSGASAPISVALRALGADTIEPLDLIFGSHCDLLDEEVYTNVVDLAASGLIGTALAAPYCSPYCSKTFDGYFETEWPQLYRARHILSLVAAKS